MGGLNTITYKAEGTYDQTKKLHFPVDSSGETIENSGATIGKGYDLKQHTKSQILKDFTAIGGVTNEAIKALQDISIYNAKEAKIKASKNPVLSNLILSKEQVNKLYQISYAYEESEAKRLCTKADVTEIYGNCNWPSMSPKLKELIIDLKYRGDYDPPMRKKIQTMIVKRDYKGLAAFFNNIQNIGKVPVDRWNRRKILANALLQNVSTNNSTNHMCIGFQP